VEYTIYAPDWTWQNREVNILVVLSGAGDKLQPVKLNLVFPEGKAEDFEYKGKTEIATAIDGSMRERHAFVGIKPLSSAPRQVYPFQIRLQTAGGEAVVDYPLRTIRGAAVNPGVLAVLLPAGVAAAWCIVLLVALNKMAARGAWRTPSPQATEPEAPEAWITRNPN
ncbi:MAG: hypothetical protein RBU21_25495, partial [FCB group bacterium]|nr:hypothetical protein [FCB group bacterium]